MNNLKRYLALKPGRLIIPKINAQKTIIICQDNSIKGALMLKIPYNGKKKSRGMYNIVAAILKICKQRTRRTHVIYKADLSHEMLLVYIELCLRVGLLDEAEDDRSLTTTMKGRLFLKEYDVIERLLGNDDDIKIDIADTSQEKLRMEKHLSITPGNGRSNPYISI